MIVQCPNCQTTFNLADDRVSPDGSKVRCTRCGNVFTVWPEQPEAAEAGEGLPGDQAASQTDAEALASAEADTEPLVVEESVEEPSADKGFGLDIPAPPQERKKKRALFVILVVLLLLGGGAAAMTSLGLWDKVPVLSRFLGHAQQEDKGPAAAAEAVKGISLENVRQYYVNNEKAGQLFVIEGKAVNNFDTPRELIKVQASLFDANGAAVVTKDVLCGNTISLYQLQVMSQEELDAALASQVGILTNNTNLKTGADTPFMVVFAGSPDSVKEFGVKVVSAKQAPAQ